MEVSMDFKAILNTMMIAGIESSNTKDSKQIAAIMKVFAKHGIGVMDAIALLAELSEAIKNTEK